MRHLLLLALALSFAPFASAQVWAGDGFEAYNVGDLCYQAGCPNVGATGGWDGWYGDQTMVGVVADSSLTGIPAHGGTKYLDVTGRDAVQPFPANATGGLGAMTGATYTTWPQTGAWRLSAWAYVPTGGVGAFGSGMNGFFIVNNQYDHTANANWCLQVEFYDNAGVLECADNDGHIAPVALSYDTWTEIIFEVCLDNNTSKCWVGGTLLSDRIYSTGGVVELQNIDLYSDGGVIYFDDLAMTSISCPAQAFQTNTPNAGFDVDGFTSTPFSAGEALGLSFLTSHTATLTSALLFQPFDLALVAEAPVSSATPPGAATANAQAININLASPSLLFLFNAAGTVPHPGTLALPFTAPAVAAPLTVSGQQVVVDPSHPDGFSLSGCSSIKIEVCPTGVDEGFEAPNWVPGVPGTFNAGWTATDSNAMANASWRCRSGGTPSAGTGPLAAYEGTQYIYYEASCPNVPVTCGGIPNIGTMESPPVGHANAFSTASVVFPALIFAVNAFGGPWGTFSVEEWDQVNGAWAPIADPQASFSSSVSATQAEWRIRKVPLTNYGTGFVQFRFVYDTGTTASWTGDIAIDAISICEQ